MNTKHVKTCFTITFTEEQYNHAKSYVEDMKKHPNRIFWKGKKNKTDEELVIEQITHRILSGFYSQDTFASAQYILGMNSSFNGN